MDSLTDHMRPEHPEPETHDAFERELDAAFGRLRCAIAELFAAIRADPDKPQGLSRRLKINKNLAWKASRLVGAESPASGVAHIPGAAGLDLLLRAFRDAGAPAEAVHAVREARHEFDQFVERHAGDRASLDLIVDSMSGGWHSDRLEVSRRFAFQGNSGIWGIQTRVRYTLALIAPNAADSARLDVCIVGAYIDCRRLRRSGTWPIFKIRASDDSGAPSAVPSAAPPEGTDIAVGTTRLIPRFCSEHMPTVEVVRDKSSLLFELGRGAIGNTGRFDCVFGSMSRAFAPRYRAGSDNSGRIYANVSVPSERLLFDVVIHNDLPYASAATPLVYSALRDHVNPAEPQPRDQALPITEVLERIGAGLEHFTSPLVPRHRDVVQCVLDAGGWAARDFHAIRLQMQYPPLPSYAVIEFPLPERPKGG